MCLPCIRMLSHFDTCILVPVCHCKAWVLCRDGVLVALAAMPVLQQLAVQPSNALLPQLAQHWSHFVALLPLCPPFVSQHSGRDSLWTFHLQTATPHWAHT